MILNFDATYAFLKAMAPKKCIGAEHGLRLMLEEAGPQAGAAAGVQAAGGGAGQQAGPRAPADVGELLVLCLIGYFD